MSADHRGSDSNEKGQAALRPRPLRSILLAGLLLLAGGIVGASWWFLSATDVAEPGTDGQLAQAAPDPRKAYDGPFRNIDPDVSYVGDARCIECHKEIHDTYSEHPMGRSLLPVVDLPDKPSSDAEHNNPFTAFGIQFSVDRRDDQVFHGQTQLNENGERLYDFAHRVDYVIGSGARGHSYLTCRDGYVFQTPISWFSEKDKWDLSPGFARWTCTGRLVPAECLYCHTNRVEPVEGTRNRYEQPIFHGHAIGCERCHGPGELHVKSTQSEDIVNPARLEPALREAVCQQCHLEGATRVLRRGRGLNDFRPGMPLEAFWTVYIRGETPGKEGKAVNHVEQMYESLCYQRSPRELFGCTTCHNPHEKIASERRTEHFRAACLKCHQKVGCSVPEPQRLEQEPNDSCVVCHMPRSETSDIAHIAGTDHRIVRQAGEEPENRRGQRPHVPLLDFYRGSPDVRDPDQARDLAVALYQMSLRGMPLTDVDADFIVGLLNESLESWPDDLDAWEAKGKILHIVQRSDAAIVAFEELLKRSPRHEGALVTLGQIYRDLEHTEEAAHYWQEAIAVNPHVADYHRNLVLALTKRSDWKAVKPICRRWLDLDPGSLEARRVWVECLRSLGESDEANRQADLLQALEAQERP